MDSTAQTYRVREHLLQAVLQTELAVVAAAHQHFLSHVAPFHTGGIRLTASGPVLVQQPAAAGRVRASWQRRAYACGCACCLRKRTPSSMCCASQ